MVKFVMTPIAITKRYAPGANGAIRFEYTQADSPDNGDIVLLFDVDNYSGKLLYDNGVLWWVYIWDEHNGRYISKIRDDSDVADRMFKYLKEFGL